MHFGHPTQSTPPPKLNGAVPGALDETQTQRVIRYPGSKLSFAFYDPYTASSNHESPPPLHSTSSPNEQPFRPKRIVIETTSSGQSTWRFVPSARLGEGVTDEGEWPRVVEICGNRFEISQEQWDIYKLDPAYHCLVLDPPQITIITPSAVTDHSSGPCSPIPGRKRRVFTSVEEDVSPPLSPLPRKKRVPVQVETDSEETEIESMIVDDGLQERRSASRSGRGKDWKEKIRASRKERQERTARRTEWLSHRGTMDTDNPTSQGFTINYPTPQQAEHVSASTTIGKRKVTSLSDTLRTNDAYIYSPDAVPYPNPNDDDTELSRNRMNYVATKNAKRTRTVSPTSAKRSLAAQKQARERQKAGLRRLEQEMRKKAREEELLGELYKNSLDANPLRRQETVEMISVNSDSDAEDEQEHAKSDGGEKTPTPGENVDDEEAIRQARIAESRRKLAELEADRPLWERAAAERRELEQREAEARAEAHRRAEAEKAQREWEERRRKEEESQQRLREEAARRHAEQEDRARQQRQRMRRERESIKHGYWSVERAKERYIDLSERFDRIKFGVDEVPLTASDVPWPMLRRDFDLEDVTWHTVAEFFNAVRPTMKAMEFKKLIIKSHVRFHTDRWASRRLFESVKDEAERECLEIASKMVIQQLTPIWEEVCGKKAQE